MKRLKIVIAPCITVVALATLFLTGWTGAAAAIPTQHTHNASSCGAWSQVASPNVGTSYNVLNGVAAISTHNAWAVGAYGNGNGSSPLIEHWSKSKWTVVSSPNIAGSLAGIAAIAANNIWAVGENDSSNMQETLVEHWNGKAWSIISSPNDIQILTEHWNGSAWSVVTSSGPGLAINRLNGVAAISAHNVWAVGEDTNSSAPSAEFNPLIEHWNGSSWSVVTSTLQGTSDLLNGIAAVSSRNIWVVGDYRSGIDPMGPYFTLIEHWNGSAWTVVNSPSPGSLASDLVAAARVPATRRVWAVGFIEGTIYQTLTAFRC